MNKLKIKAISIFISLVCLISIVAPGLLVPHNVLNNEVLGAANVELKIMIGDSTTKRQHMALTVGKTSETYSFKLTNAKVKSATYKSTNEDAFKIVNLGNNKCCVRTESEGVGYVVLTVKDTNNKTHTAKVFVSSCAEIEDADGYIKNNNVNVYMGASEKTEATNYEIKGTVNANQKVRIWTRCGNYYCLDVPGKTFRDGKSSGFIKKSDIRVPLAGIKIEKKNIELMEDKEYCVDLVGVPSYCDEKDKLKADWSSSDRYVALVTRAAIIHGYNKGKCVITATYGKHSAKCNVTVTPKKEIAPEKPRYLSASKLNKKYRYSFDNSYDCFNAAKYYINAKDKDIFVSKIFDYYNYIGKPRYKKDIISSVNEEMNNDWNGSCYGMCVSMMSNRIYDINVRKYTGMVKGKGYQLKKVKTPKKSARVKSLINYYHFLQDYCGTTYYPNDKNKTSLEDGIRQLYKYANSNIASGLGIYYYVNKELVGHEIISLNINVKKTKASKSWIYINSIDPNFCPITSVIKISKDFKSVKIDGYNDIKMIDLQPDVNDFKIIDIDS